VRYAKNTKDYPTQFISAFAPLPKWDKGSKLNYNSQPTVDEYWVINTKSKNKAYAWEVIKYAGTVGYYPMCSGGKTPSWKNTNKDLVIKLFLGENPEKIFDIESVKRVAFADSNYFITQLTPARSEVVTMLERESEKCLADQQTVDQTLQVMKQKAADIVAKAGK
jgi:multiple sugar transport system substrate-binding protein